jgi:hypothetical protein
MRKLYVEMRYTETRSLTQVVCFELDEVAVDGMTDDEIMEKYGKRLTCAAADGGMEEPDGDEWGWDQDSLDLSDFSATEAASATDGIYDLRTERPSWVPEICAKAQ